MPRPVRKPLNTYHHGDLRDALVQAALQEVELGGPEAINISALAKKLGVSQPAPYKHFADRETLLVAVTAEAFRQFSAMLRASIVKPSNDLGSRASAISFWSNSTRLAFSRPRRYSPASLSVLRISHGDEYQFSKWKKLIPCPKTCASWSSSIRNRCSA